MSTPAKTKTGGFPIGIRMTGEFDKLAAGDIMGKIVLTHAG